MSWPRLRSSRWCAEDAGARGRVVAGMAALLFLAVYVVFFPATYAIEDERSILSLSSALSHGTVFLDRAGIESGADVISRGHTVSKYSPFHAALLVPALLSAWRLSFLVTAAFTLLGAWVVVRMLEREGLSSAWVLLYFLNPGLLYYSRTIMSMVPAAVMALLGVSLLYRARPHPAAGGLALGTAVLFHIWLAPLAVVVAGCWWIERKRCAWRPAGDLVAGALPAILLMGLYNFVTMGNPLVNSYWMIGHQRVFNGAHWAAFGVYYGLALLSVPPGGWVALTRRWAGSYGVPLAIATTVALATLYYFRDGLAFGIAGWVPGLRFLLPATLLAVVPSARWWNNLTERFARNARLKALVAVGGVVVFGLAFAGLSAAHQNYLTAQRSAQAFIAEQIPDGARVVGVPGTFKLFAPVVGHWPVELVYDTLSELPPGAQDAYLVWIGPTGEDPGPAWCRGRLVRTAIVSSWIWRRKVVVAGPMTPGRSARSDGPRAAFEET